MDRRKEPRVKLEMSVRIWGVDRNARPFTEIVRARNISSTGAELSGVRSKIHAHELLDVQNGKQRAQFRVIWIGPGEIGIQALPSEPPIWGAGVPKTFEMVGTG